MAPATDEIIDTLFDANWVEETSHLCRINTVRDDADGPLNPNILLARNYLLSRSKLFNDEQKALRFTSFQWAMDFEQKPNYDPTDDDIRAAKFYVFGLRLGPADARYKVCVICHLDVVPADSSWGPFEPAVEAREYPEGYNGNQDFLVGRGCLDDKGPAVAAFLVGRALARKFDGSGMFDDVAFEVLFDGSEETLMSTPQYLVDPNVHVPHFGVVFDAFWCTRAEKGVERPKFWVDLTAPPADPAALHVAKVESNPDNSANTIPDWTAVTIKCADQAKLDAFTASVQTRYDAYGFDDPDYNPAPLTVDPGAVAGTVTLRASVKGSQHGSSPEENRAKGWNPLVSLAHFVSSLAADGTVARGAYTTLCEFIASTWGTFAFGEPHDSLHKADKDIFTDGTTYAVTKVSETAEGACQLELDIRYALAHHSVAWDGVSEGWVGEEDPSVFGDVFGELVRDFNAARADRPPVQFSVNTVFAPDVRVPETNESFQKVARAYESVTGEPAPMLAIGGGTDAKGMTNLLAVGPLFSTVMGPPVNYHGISEGAPIADMRLSTAILYKIMELEVEEAPRDSAKFVTRVREVVACLQRAHARGVKHRCAH